MLRQVELLEKVKSYDPNVEEELLNKAYVASCPGDFFGSNGEGFVRFCFANSLENIQAALIRIKSFVNNL